jgi:hypothetical protein
LKKVKISFYTALEAPFEQVVAKIQPNPLKNEGGVAISLNASIFAFAPAG